MNKFNKFKVGDIVVLNQKAKRIKIPYPSWKWLHNKRMRVVGVGDKAVNVVLIDENKPATYMYLFLEYCREERIQNLLKDME